MHNQDNETFLEEVHLVEMGCENRRDTLRAAGDIKGASLFIRCVSDLEDLERALKKFIDAQPYPGGRD